MSKIAQNVESQNKIVAIIPIKLNNERLPNKNLLPLGAKPLIYYIQNTLLKVKQISEIYIYCSDESIKPYILDGVKFLKRPKSLDSNHTNFTQIFNEFYKEIQADIYIYTHATSPFISDATITKCIDKVQKGGFDSAFSAQELQDFFWDSSLNPINFDSTNIPRSQDLSPIYKETSGCYVFKKEVFLSYKTRIGKNPFIINLSKKEAIDINTKEDFLMALSFLNYTEEESVESQNIKLLDCTLRDGGYINSWNFGFENIKYIIESLTKANIDFIELGYLNPLNDDENKSIFKNIETIKEVLPDNHKSSKFLAMCDVAQVSPKDITNYSGESIDGLRIVFYKHQISEALALCEKSLEAGYLTFMQPMVSIDYTLFEYENLIKQICLLNPHGIAIVDSFGYMNSDDFRKYFAIIDTIAASNLIIGFHSHNNMHLAFNCAKDILNYKTNRTLLIDSSICGMGRGAGNLNAEIIAQYYNCTLGRKYDLEFILDILSEIIEPLRSSYKWGYTPYYFLTAIFECHPNFATYLLEEHPKLSVNEFSTYLKALPSEMKTKCKKPYVLELYEKVFKIK